MNILVIGSGGREHALAWKLAQSQKVNKIYIAPGNAGTAVEAKCENVALNDFAALVRFAKEKHIALTVVGPEIPLCNGIVDIFEAEGLRIFGPNKAAAQIEGSKTFCKKILKKGNVPTAAYQAFTRVNEAIGYINDIHRRSHFAGFVVKADGLAAGKGVFVCNTAEEAVKAVQQLHEFGSAGHQFIIEEKLEGQEASVLAITDGHGILMLQPAQDHKAAYDGDTGPNTGGMGAYSPAPLVNDAMLHWIEEHIFVPTIHALNQNGTPFKGVLYAGLMIDVKRSEMSPIKVLEYNARFGDPECQPLMMRLKTDLVDILEAAVSGRVAELPPLEWDDRTAICVVMASKGYPGNYQKGLPIRGLDEAAKVPDTKVFHAGTKSHREDGAYNEAEYPVTDGGRVLGVTGLGTSVAAAKLAAYSAIKPIRWDGAWCRKDISDKAEKPSVSFPSNIADND